MRRPAWPGWRRLLALLAGSDHSTRNLSTAFALGALVAPTPILGLHTWMAIGLGFALRVNRLAAFAGSNLANPLTMAPLVWLDIRVGCWLLGRPAPEWSRELLQREHLTALLGEAWLGSLVVGAVLAVSSYFLVGRLIERIRRRPRSAEARTPDTGPGPNP